MDQTSYLVSFFIPIFFTSEVEAQKRLDFHWLSEYAYIQLVGAWILGNGESVGHAPQWKYTGNARSPNNKVIKLKRRPSRGFVLTLELSELDWNNPSFGSILYMELTRHVHTQTNQPPINTHFLFSSTKNNMKTPRALENELVEFFPFPTNMPFTTLDREFQQQ